MKYFLLNPECYFVKGAKRGAIYDLDKEQIHWLEPDLSKITEMCEDGKKLSEIPEYIYDNKNALSFLKKFKELGVGDFFDNYCLLEKIKPSVKKRQKKELDIESLRHIFIELTNECNLNCAFCYKNTYKINRKTGCKRWPNAKNITVKLEVNDWKNIICDCNKIECKNITFIGGEPLLAKGMLKKMIEYAKEIDIENIKIFTNGVLLDRELLNIFRKNNVELIIQIYSHIGNITNQITRVRNAHTKLIKNIIWARNLGIKFYFNLIQLKKYSNYYNETIRFYEQYNPSKILINPIFPKQFEPYTSLLDGFSKRLYRKNANETIGKGISKYLFFQRCEGHSCWDSMLAITESGNVIPCPMARNEIIGNINNKSIREIFRDRDAIKYWNMNRDYVDICKDCEFRYACFDCRPLEKSYSKSNHINERTEYCTYDPYNGIWMS